MFKPVISLLLVLFFLSAIAVINVHALQDRDSVIDRTGDWFATMGKPDNVKHAIVAQRRMKRSTARLEKETERNNREFENNMKSATGR
jgi:hypothetical protein